MATPLELPRTSSRRPAGLRRMLIALAGAAGILLSAVPASATPTSAEVGQLVAARGHDLEVVTEKFNEARETLTVQRAAAEAAIAQLDQATATLGEAQQQVRGIARTAYTGSGLNSFQALMTSDSATDFVGRMTALQMVAGHQADILGAAAEARAAAVEAQAGAQKLADEAQATYDSVAAAQTDLQKQVSDYQALFDRLSAQEQQAAVNASHSDDRASRSVERDEVSPSGPVVAGSEAAQIAVDTAMAQRGKPYVWAASGPGSFDCSGLMAYAYAAAGVGLPHSSAMQARIGEAVSRDQLRPGDLLFFYSPVSHVGMYIGNGQMVHAPTSGDVVKVANVASMGGFNSARRIAG